MTTTCVIYNPRAGRGRAKRMIGSARQRFGADTVFRATTAPGHAVELAREAAREGFAKVVAAGGDGTVHEVANGLLESGRPDVVLSVLPIGSMNDFAYTSGMDGYWESGGRYPTEVAFCDVGRISSPGRSRYFVNSIGIGFTGFVTVESRKIKHIRGLMLYSLALFRAVAFHFSRPCFRMEWDGQRREGPTLALSVFLGQREGGFPLVPAARNNDGLFDFVFAGQMRWWEIVKYFPAMILGRLPKDHPELQLSQCQKVELFSPEALCIHADGELFCVPQDQVFETKVELLPKRLAVEVCSRFRFGGRA